MNIKYKHPYPPIDPQDEELYDTLVQMLRGRGQPIDPQDEKLYDIELHDGTCIEGVEFWDFGDGFISHPRKERREMVDYHISDIISFQLSEKEQK